MTTATRKAKTPASKLPLLQKGDRIRGTSPSGTQHAGTFEGYSSQDLILCKEGERTIALNPASVERVAEPNPKLPTKITEVNSVAIYQGAAYYSEPKQGAWRLASDAEIADLEKGDRVSASEIPWVYTFVKLGGDGTGDMVAVCAFVDHPCFHYHILVARLQVAGVRSQESGVSISCQDFHPGDRVRITAPGFLPGHTIGQFDINRLGTVQTSWDSQQQASEFLKVLLDGDEICRALKPDWVERVEEDETAIAPPPAPNPAAQLSVLAVEILALYADAEQAEATMLNAGKAALSLYIALGEKLLAVKNQIGHGEWLPWLKARKIQERKAQRAIAVFKGFPQLAAKNDSVTDLTLTEALSQLSKKALKSAAPDQDGTQNSKLTPDAIERQYSLTGDHATPTLDELMLLYSQLGAVRPWRKGFAVERDDMGAPFPLAFQNRATAWKRWQTEWRSFAATHPLPATVAPLDALPAIPEKTDGLEGEKRASDPYEYEPIDPRPVWFDPGGGVVEGQAIAANGKGFVRIVWGEGREADVPRDRVSWSDPAITAVSTEIETGLAAIGLEVCQPSITPEEFNRAMWGEANPALRPVQPNGLVEDRLACSRWEREEVDHVARIQLQGLLKHLEPVELVKAAIVHSGVSLSDVVRVVLALANKDDSEQILEVLDRGLQA